MMPHRYSLAALALLLGSACTQSYDDFSFGGTSTGGSGATTTSSGGQAPGGGGAGGSGGSGGAGADAGQAGQAGQGGQGGAGGSASCGDGTTNPPAEQCDDGNTTPGDRCGATCLTENPDDCPGTPISLGPAPLVIHDTTTGANDTSGQTSDLGTCFLGTWPGVDLIYAVTPTVSGQLQATLEATYNGHYLLARSECPGATEDLACDAHQGSGSPDQISFAVTAGTLYYVRVDSYQSTAGGFTLTLTLN